MNMETTVNKISDVEFELEIKASADELKPEVDQALKAQRGRTQAKGFRPGKVPLSMVKKMYGEALAFGVAEQKVQKIYDEQILNNDDYDVVGQPILTDLDYQMDADLRAVIRFGIRPEVTLQDLSDVSVPRLKLEVTDELVEEQLEEFRRSNADLTPSDEPVGETDQVVFDLQEIDVESNTPIIGRREEDRQAFLDDANFADAWKNGLLGKKAGETFRVDIPHGEDHIHRYEVTLKEVKRRELPELDDETVKELTKESIETVDALRETIRGQITSQMDEQTRELFESQLVRKVLDLHPIPVPRQAVDLYLDSFVEDVKQRNRGSLPDNFDEAAFRESNRAEAEQQARWMFIRDQIIEEQGLDVDDEDLEAYFADLGQDEQFSPAMMRQYYDQIGMTERVRQRLLSTKVFDAISAQVTVEELNEEAYAEAMKEQQPEVAGASDDAETAD